MLDQELVHNEDFRKNLLASLLRAKKDGDTDDISIFNHLLEEIKFRRLGITRAFEVFEPNDEPKKKMFTRRGLTKVYEVDESGKIIAIVEPTKKPKSNPTPPISLIAIALRNLNQPNHEEDHRKETYPSICNSECTHRTCPYFTLDNFGKPCLQQHGQYKHQPQPQGTLPTERDTSNPTILENIPEYHVRMFKPDSNMPTPKIIKKRLSTFRLGALM